MDSPATPPWLDPDLFVSFSPEHPYGLIAGDGSGLPLPDDHPTTIAALLEHDEHGAISLIWSPQGVETIYETDAAGPAVLSRDQAVNQHRLHAAKRPCLLLAIGLAVGLGWLLHPTAPDPGLLVLVAILGGIHLIQQGPQQAWVAWLHLRRIAADPDGYRRDCAAGLRCGLWLSRRGHPFTMTLLVLLGLVFFAQLAIGLNTSILSGGLVKDLVRQGEWWRLASAGLLHANPMHIIFNGVALLSLGRLCEPLLGGGHLLMVFLLGCLGGNLASLWLLPEGVSVGASSGLMAIGGYLLANARMRPELRQIGLDADLLRWTALIALIGLLGYRFIDNAAHLGGWLTGVALALILTACARHRYSPRGDRLLAVLALAGLGTVLVDLLLRWQSIVR